MGSGTNHQDILMNPTTLRIFIHYRLNPTNDPSIRKIQKLVDVKSPSTVSWHLNKLVDAELLEKNESNRYVLTEFGQNLNEIQVPTTISAQIIRGRFMPQYSILLGILFFSLVFNLLMVILRVNSGAIIINSMLIGIIAFSIVFRDWYKFIKQFRVSEEFK